MGNELIFGEYSNARVLIDMCKNKTQYQQDETIIHELGHHLITSNSTCGFLDFLLEQLCKSESIDKMIKNKATKIYKTIYKYSIQVQESMAVFMELSFIKSVDTNEYKSLCEYYKSEKGRTYYQEYRFKELEDFLNNDTDDTNVFKLLRIAFSSMNINIRNLTPTSGAFTQTIKKNLDKYSPNHRFFRIIKYIKKHKVSLKDLSKEKLIDIYNILGMPYQEIMEFKDFSIWAKHNILNPLGIGDTNVEYFIKFRENEFMDSFMFSIAGYSSCDRYKKYQCNDKTKFNELYKNSSNMLFLNRYNNSSEILCLIDTYYGNEYFSNKIQLNEIDLNIHKPILIDRNHYDYMLDKFPIISKSILFVDIAGLDIYAKEFINRFSTKQFFIATVNKNFFVIFIIGNKNQILFLSIPAMAFNEVYKKYLNGYKIINQQKFDNSMLGNLCIYDDLIFFLCNEKMNSDINEETPIVSFIFGND